MMQTMKQIQQSIITSKELLRTNFDVKTSFTLAQSNINKEVDDILEMQHKEIPVIPEIDYKSIINGEVSFNEIDYIKRRGPRSFEYRINLEIKNELTPEVWLKKEL